MELAEAIRTRRSVGVFTDQQVDPALVLELLETAVWVPNHKLTEPWRFVFLSGEAVARYAAARRDMALDVCALEDEGARRQVGDRTYQKFVCIPAYLAIIMKDNKDPEIFEEDFASTAALTQNFMLLAWERGLGTFWKTFKNDRRLREMLDLADDERVVGWLHLGYPSGATAPTRRSPSRERFTVLDGAAALSAEKASPMCKNLILLAQNDRQQMIFTCEHGTVHVTHQKTTICMSSTAFQQFTDLLAEGDLTTFNESSLGSVRESADGQIELWIGSGGLRLHADEFFSLSDLLRTAARQLDRLPVTRSSQPKHYLN